MGPQRYPYLYGKETVNEERFIFLNHASHPLLNLILPIFTFLGSSKMFYLYTLILLGLSLPNKNIVPQDIWGMLYAIFSSEVQCGQRVVLTDPPLLPVFRLVSFDKDLHQVSYTFPEIV